MVLLWDEPGTSPLCTSTGTGPSRCEETRRASTQSLRLRTTNNRPRSRSSTSTAGSSSRRGSRLPGRTTCGRGRASSVGLVAPAGVQFRTSHSARQPGRGQVALFPPGSQ
eukprot:1890577-Rhodomonas_salina.2